MDRQTWQIVRGGIRAGLLEADVRVEMQLDGSMAVRFRGSYLAVSPYASHVPKCRAPK